MLRSPPAPAETRPAHGQAAAYPDIGDYGLIGDGRTAALVARSGAIEWLCLPHFSGPAFFAALLDRESGGHFTVRPAVPCRIERNYVGASAVLETRFRTETGILVLRDAMTMPAGDDDELKPQRELLRSVEAVGGEVPVEIVYAPRPDYARAVPRLVRRGAVGWACPWRDHMLLLRSDLDLTPSGDATVLRLHTTLRPGRRHHLSLTYVRDDIGIALPLGPAADARLRATTDWWGGWSGGLAYDGPHRDAVLRSAVTLKLLAYSLSGAIVAAPTTSLPESVGGSRNWDYRFCWLRDASLTLEALTGLGCLDEARSFLDWLLHATRLTWPKLQVVYDVHGEAKLPERTLDHLDGFRGSRPVRIGNGAWDQRQLDVYGSVIMAVAEHMMRGGTLSRGERRQLVRLGDTVCREWRKPDHGIWEMRGPGRHYTYSKVTCWAALDCLVDLAERGRLRAPVGRFRQERDAIRRAVDTDGFDPRLGSYVGVFGHKLADAGLLLMPRFRYRAADDPRLLGTFAYLERRLGHGPLLYRYDPGADALEGRENPFGICGFWAVDFLARAGRVRQAEERFDHLLGYASDLGLYGEEIDAETGAALGNFPQAFTHVGLINAALSLARTRGRP